MSHFVGNDHLFEVFALKESPNTNRADMLGKGKTLNRGATIEQLLGEHIGFGLVHNVLTHIP